MFQIKIHPIDITPELMREGRKNTAFKMRMKMCEKLREAVLEHISVDFEIDQIDETLYLKFYATNDKIKMDYAHIKNQKFNIAVERYIKGLYSGIGFVF